MNARRGHQIHATARRHVDLARVSSALCCSARTH
ncbi:putative leader peptide [Micromonospora mangrovi]